MGVIAKYKFNQEVYADFIPEFNSEFTDYTITDEIDTDGYTIRTIESDSLPTLMRFGATTQTDREKSLLQVYECNTENVTNMNSMFNNCSSLTSLDVSNFNIENITSMNSMFANCSSLISLDVSNFNTGNITNMNGIFNNCSSLTFLDLSNFNTENVTDMSWMFYNCSSLISLDVSNFNTENVTTMMNMFQYCSSLTSLDVSNFNTEKVTTMVNMFNGCSKLTLLNISNFNTQNVINMTSMFHSCSSLTHLDISLFDGSALTTGCGSMFFGCVLLQEIIFPKKFITNKCTNISAMFRNCPSLKYVDVSDWDTSSVTTINQTFNGCSSLTSLDLSSWDTTNVTSYYQTFNGCTSLQTLDISNFNILSSVTDVNTHITLCKKLVHVGMLYCNSETINIIVNQIGSTTRTIWYQDASLSDLTQLDNITYKKYQSTTLSLNEPIQLRSIGDIHDEINYETGEYIQRIYELILDGSDDEDWEKAYGAEGTYRIMQIKNLLPKRGNIMSYTISDKYAPIEIYSTNQSIGYCFVQGDDKKYTTIRVRTEDVMNNISVSEFKQWLSENPITIQFALLEPITTKIDTTILDQDNNYKSSQQTYDESTHISVQSDTVVTPSSSVDYEIYSSTGTITGTSATIENAEAGTPVSGVVYGETLLNVIQESSEDEFVCTDNFSGKETTIENSVAGNVKDVIIKGETLIDSSTVETVTNYRTIENMQPTCTYTENSGTYWCDTATVNPTVGNQYFIKIFNNPNNAITRFFYGGVIVDTTTDYGIITATDRTGVRLHFYNLNSATVTITEEQKNAIRFLICEYQDGMENWEINEHFEESYTVQMPVLKTVGKNLFTYEMMETAGTNYSVGVSWEDMRWENPRRLRSVDTFNINPSKGATLKVPDGYVCAIIGFKNNLSVSDTGWQNPAIIQPGDYDSIGFSIRYGETNISVDSIKELAIQLEEGTTATTYEPYKSTTVTVNENIELNSIGDVYDELNVTTGELTQNIMQVVLNGESSLDYGGGSSTYNTCLIAFKNIDGVPTGMDMALQNNLVPMREGSYGEGITGCSLGTDGRIFLTMEGTDLDSCKAQLNTTPLIVHIPLEQPIIRTLDLSILDQSNEEQDYIQLYDTITYLKPQSYELIPTVEYKNPSYDVLLKENTQYTIKSNRTNIIDGTPLTVNLGGTELSIEDSADSFTITTLSTLTNNALSIGGFGNRIKEVMIIEGDYVDRDLDFFEGFIHVENPIIDIYNDELNNINFYSLVEWETGAEYSKLCRLPVKGATIWYKVYGSMWNYIKYYDKDKNFLGQETNQGMGGSYQLTSGLLEPELKSKAVYFSINKRGNPTNGGYPQLRTQNNASDDVPPTPLNEICRLTTYPQVTLRSMGDIKDEWDVVGETVTRRIGEVVFDGDTTKHSYYLADNAPTNENYINYRCVMSYDMCQPRAYNNNWISDFPKGSENPNTWHNTDYVGGNWYGSQDQKHVFLVKMLKTSLPSPDLEGVLNYLHNNPIEIIYELETPITESVRITPPSPQTSTASITIPTQLNHVEDTSDFLVWNPYKEHYVRYNYVEDGVVLDNYTWENLTDLNERQFVEFYNKRTYIDQPYYSYVASHDSKGTSKYVLIEPNQDYTVNVRFSELPTCETVKVNLGGTEVEMNVNNPHVHVTTPNTLVNNLCSISGDGLDGKVTDILVIHCLEHEGFADVDYFEGIDGIGEIVEVDGVGKASIVMEQTNGNLLDFEPVVFNNGNYISMAWDDISKSIPLKANTSYRLKMRKSKYVTLNNGWGDVGARLYTSEMVNTRNININHATGAREFTTANNEKYLRFYKQQSTNGNTNIHEPLELTYAHFTDNELIRPRYYDKEEILLPMQLHRINTVYDNFYYDEMKGFYRIQQSIGHKYFVGADSENWTLIERGQRVLRFRYNNADVQIKSLGEFMTNRLPNGTATSPYECCAFSGSTFIVSIDKERLTSESLIAFKEWLANNNLHLYYQLASPLMIDLPQYPNRIEFNTYKDEIYTFFKNCKPTVFTLAVPLDQTYRFYDLEEGQGYANRIELTDERMTEEDKLYVHTIYGSGISNLIEEPNNVDTMLKPNYEGKATSHSLTNGKVSTIGVHGFEANDVTIENYNTVTKQYELTVQAQQGTNTNTETLAVPYKLEIYEDGTKDRVYYNSQYKQWMFEGGQTLTVPYNESTGAFTSVVEVFRGLQPRSGLIGEFKVRFASGTTSARLYYSINGTTYGYTTLRGMTDEVDYYIGFFNTGGTKIDMGTKIDANAEYTTLVPINATVPECLMINQIQSITECTYYQDKTYYYLDVVSPLLLDVYDGTTTITELNGAVIDIQNNAHNKQALIYGDTTYTVYWTYVGGEGNIKVTLGGVTQEVAATQGYVTITTSDTDLERGLLIGGFDVTIKDLMLIKGERITDLKYFEGSRAVGTAFTDEDGNTMYRITFVTGSELINDKFEDMITFEDNKKHNVVVTKLLGAKPDKN